MRSTCLMLLVASLQPACATRPSELIHRSDNHMVVVKCARLPSGEPWIARFAEHSWVDVRGPDDSSWQRVELISRSSGVRMLELSAKDAYSDTRWLGRAVHVVRCFRGPQAERLRRQILDVAPHYPDEAHYRAFPGPNSNTFIEWLCRAVDGLDVARYSSAGGKAPAGWLRAGRAGTGRGVELETLPVGVQIGLDEGVEMHILGLVVGVGTWPPRIKLPLLPGWPYWSAAGAEPMAVPPATVP